MSDKRPPPSALCSILSETVMESEATVESFISPGHGGRIFLETQDGKHGRRSELWICFGSPFKEETVSPKWVEVLKPLCSKQQFEELTEAITRIVDENSTHSPKPRVCGACRDKCCVVATKLCAPCILLGMCLSCGCLCCPCILICLGKSAQNAEETVVEVGAVKEKVSEHVKESCSSWTGVQHVKEVRVVVVASTFTTAKKEPVLDSSGSPLTYEFSDGLQPCFPPIGLSLVVSYDTEMQFEAEAPAQSEMEHPHHHLKASTHAVVACHKLAEAVPETSI